MSCRRLFTAWLTDFLLVGCSTSVCWLPFLWLFIVALVSCTACFIMTLFLLLTLLSLSPSGCGSVLHDSGSLPAHLVCSPSSSRPQGPPHLLFGMLWGSRETQECRILAKRRLAIEKAAADLKLVGLGCWLRQVPPWSKRIPKALC